jgi:hypothetical protein
MQKLANIVMAVSLAVIAVNMTVNNTSKPAPEPKKVTEEIVPVLGRAYTEFDGIGISDTGFLVKKGSEFKMLRYDEGSIAANPQYKPKYMKVINWGDGKETYVPLTVFPIQ